MRCVGGLREAREATRWIECELDQKSFLGQELVFVMVGSADQTDLDLHGVARRMLMVCIVWRDGGARCLRSRGKRVLGEDLGQWAASLRFVSRLRMGMQHRRDHPNEGDRCDEPD